MIEWWTIVVQAKESENISGVFTLLWNNHSLLKNARSTNPRWVVVAEANLLQHQFWLDGGAVGVAVHPSFALSPQGGQTRYLAVCELDVIAQLIVGDGEKFLTPEKWATTSDEIQYLSI